jgi:hypothetical protein
MLLGPGYTLLLTFKDVFVVSVLTRFPCSSWKGLSDLCPIATFPLQLLEQDVVFLRPILWSLPPLHFNDFLLLATAAIIILVISLSLAALHLAITADATTACANASPDARYLLEPEHSARTAHEIVERSTKIMSFTLLASNLAVSAVNVDVSFLLH